MSERFQIGPATKPFQYFFRLADVVALEAAYYLAYLTVPLVRGTLFPDERLAFGEEITFSTALLIPLIWLVVLQVRGLYGDPARIPYSQIFTRLLQTTLLGLGIVTLVLFAFKQGELSRLLFFIFGVYSFLILVIVRVADKLYFVNRHRTGYYSERLLVVGQPDAVRTIQRAIADLDSLKDYEIVGYFDIENTFSARSCAEDTQANEPHPKGTFSLGKIQNLRREIAKRQVSEVLVVWGSGTPELVQRLEKVAYQPNGYSRSNMAENPDRPPHFQVDALLDFILDACREMGTRIRIIPGFALDFAPVAPSKVVTRAESFWGLPSIVLSAVKWQPEQEFLKRMMDVFVSAILLITLSPILLIIALAVKFSSPGPVLHRYTMVGKDGRMFRGQKFRSMVDNAHAMRSQLEHRNEMRGPVFKIKNDPRVTRVGHWLRKFSLDEIPQLWNVLKGDMSLVGPRPPGPYEAEEFADWHWKKMRVKPGMTSLWIVRGKPSDFDEWVRLDIEYINNWSLWLDFVILVKTVPVVLLGRNS